MSALVTWLVPGGQTGYALAAVKRVKKVAVAAAVACTIAACAQPMPQPCAGGPAPAPTTGAPVSEPAAAGSTRPAAAPTGALGVVGGREIGWSDLADEVHSDLRELESSLAQRKLHLIWAGVETAIDQHLIRTEADRRGMTVAELRAVEIESALTALPTEELRAIYDRNSDRIGVPFEVAAPHIEKELRQQQKEQLEQELVGKLRETAAISYNLPVPKMPRLEIDDGGAPALGPAGAKVTLVEFSDFECPYCGRASRVLKELMAFYPNDLRLVFRDFPLAQHPRARAAAEAAQCANEQGAFWPYHDLLFANATALLPEELERYAQEVGLDLDLFRACLASERPAGAVASHEAAAERYGVEGTPAIFLNGVKLIGLLPLPLMRALIDEELRAP